MNPSVLIGRGEIRQDAQEKAKGAYVYGMDFSIPGSLEAVVLRSPVPHARIVKIERRPGGVAAGRSCRGPGQ